MAHTKEQRSTHALCGAKKKNGEQCRKFAGEGTNHPGVGRCKYHLGNSKKHQIHAAKLEAKKLAIDYATEFGREIGIDPGEALLSVLHLSYGHLMFIRAELGAIKDQPSFERDVLVNAWDLERDRVARIAKACVDAGVEERRMALAEQYGGMLAELLRGIFWDPELKLTNKQHAALPAILRRHLVPVDGAAPTARALPAASA